MIKNERNYLLRQLQEIQADFEDFTNEEIIEHKDVILSRVNSCLENLEECEEDNIG